MGSIAEPRPLKFHPNKSDQLRFVFVADEETGREEIIWIPGEGDVVSREDAQVAALVDCAGALWAITDLFERFLKSEGI